MRKTALPLDLQRMFRNSARGPSLLILSPKTLWLGGEMCRPRPRVQPVFRMG
jgi:hypothetical protein